MKAIELARMLLLFPDATVLMDVQSDRPEKATTNKPIREIDLKASLAVSNDGYFAILPDTVRGYARAKK
jgi:hypothetical protein